VALSVERFSPPSAVARGDGARDVVRPAVPSDRDNVINLKAERAHLDVRVVFLKRRWHDVERQYRRADGAERRRLVPALDAVVTELRETQLRLQELEVEISRVSADEPGGLAVAERCDEQLAEELDSLRLEILSKLAECAEPIRRYQRLAEQKSRLARDLTSRTGRDRGYANYLDCSLLRKPEYFGHLAFVVEYLKSARVVT